MTNCLDHWIGAWRRTAMVPSQERWLTRSVLVAIPFAGAIILALADVLLSRILPGPFTAITGLGLVLLLSLTGVVLNVCVVAALGTWAVNAVRLLIGRPAPQGPPSVETIR